MELIIGANGFLGQYVAWSRRFAKCILHSQSLPNSICSQTGLPFIQENLIETSEQLSRVNPEIVYLFARPVTDNARILLDFTRNVQCLLQAWADRGCLKRVIFTSTQLVYSTPTSPEPIGIDHGIGPETPYDSHKATMEFFLSLLSHHESGISVDILRLPLLAGCKPSPSQQREQLIYQWRAAYQLGYRWDFSKHTHSAEWGNSWVHVNDVINMMQNIPDENQRFKIIQPVSGHIRYQELDQWFCNNYKLIPRKGTIHLPQTSFFLADNASMPSREISDAFLDQTHESFN